MALVRRDESASKQLITDGSRNVHLTHCITLDRYSEEERIPFLSGLTEGQSDWRTIHLYQGKASEAYSIDLQANGMSEYYSD
jgi:hypothetical protein